MSYTALFEEICQIVEKNFYNTPFIQKNFSSIKERYALKVKTISTQTDFSIIVNSMLKELKASHTYYLSSNDYEYYHLASIFSYLPSIQQAFNNKDIMYPTIGIIAETIDDHIFIASVLSGSNAEKAGLLCGDEIIAVNGSPYEPINSLKENIGKQVAFSIKRNPNANTQTFLVTPTLINPKTEMLEAERSSIRVIEIQGRKIGYIHLYSYAGQEYQDELISAFSQGALKDADALIMDLRYGLGGADPSYLNIFNPNIPVISSKDSSGNISVYDSQWRKPAVFLVNKTSRSGKEILVFGAKKYKLATIIGERTAGAVLGARLFPLSNGDFLYLAGKSCLIDGVDLEGIGVAPDIEVPMDIRYCQGKDIQLERAINFFLETLSNEQS